MGDGNNILWRLSKPQFQQKAKDGSRTKDQTTNAEEYYVPLSGETLSKNKASGMNNIPSELLEHGSGDFITVIVIAKNIFSLTTGNNGSAKQLLEVVE